MNAFRAAAREEVVRVSETVKLNIIPPSVNNMCVRVLLRAGGIAHEEVNVFGKTRGEEYASKCPTFATPSLESAALPGGIMVESCAILSYLCNAHGLDQYYPRDPSARAVVDSANFHHTGGFYPVFARAVYPNMGFPLYPGETQTSEASDELKAAARDQAEAEVHRLLEVIKTCFIGKGGEGFIGADSPTIADMRLAASLEFAPSLNNPIADWAKAYVARVEQALGDAYTGPASDVRGFLEYLKSQRAAT